MSWDLATIQQVDSTGEYIFWPCVCRDMNTSVCTLDGKALVNFPAVTRTEEVWRKLGLRGPVSAFYVVTDFASVVAAAQASCFHSQGVPALPSNPHPRILATAHPASPPRGPSVCWWRLSVPLRPQEAGADTLLHVSTTCSVFCSKWIGTNPPSTCQKSPVFFGLKPKVIISLSREPWNWTQREGTSGK